jgi:hypothetical protein
VGLPCRESSIEEFEGRRVGGQERLQDSMRNFCADSRVTRAGDGRPRPLGGRGAGEAGRRGAEPGSTGVGRGVW